MGAGEVLHNSKVAKEGYDCPGLGLMVVTGFHSDKISLVQTIGRVIRFEPGKHSEIFILTLRGCQDNKWFQKASEGMEYIEIDEQELETVLKREPLFKTTKTSAKFRGLRY